MTNYWQVAAGSFERNYSSVFLKYGIAFVGGEVGEKTLMNEINLGDIIVLKNGLHQIIAAGEVVERNGKFKDIGDKDWLSDFDGWNLPAYCYVDWHVPENPIPTDGLTRTTIQRLPQKKHQDIANSILSQLPPEQVIQEPEKSVQLEDKDLLEFLIKEGLRTAAADELTNALRRIRLLAEYYYHSYSSWDDIREHEIRSFLILPLLLSLGWAEQQIKIELPSKNRKVDLACFSSPYKKDNSECITIIESKGFGKGLDYAPKQAINYANDFPNCSVVVVSNGYCYKTYIRDESLKTFSTTPSAYLNLLTPKKRYPLDPLNVDGALGVLKWLMPKK